MSAKNITYFWFRRDLRLEDNAGLFMALKTNVNVQPIFIFDTNILDKLSDKQDRRVSFIHVQILRLNRELIKYGSGLKVYYGNPIEIFKSLLETTSFHALYANRDYEPYARERDKEVYEILASKNISFKAFKDHVIFEKDEVIKEDGSPYVVFSPYARKWREKITSYYLKPYSTKSYIGNLNQINEIHEPISLSDMGFHEHKNDWSSSNFDISVIEKYHEKRDIPSENGTTRLSVHLRFGTASIRQLAAIGSEVNTKWYNELIWRDFYQMILWHFPHVVKDAFRSKYDYIPWRNNEAEFEAWCEGKTGYPIVDAGMRELNETGFMHNRVRMIVASFLTKHLLIDWRWGEAYFASKLIDFDLASNNGGWQWASGSGVDAAPYFRVFNPYLQTDKFDPKKKYIRRWVPEYSTPSYPDPIVDHKPARLRAIDTYKKALSKQGL